MIAKITPPGTLVDPGGAADEVICRGFFIHAAEF